MQIYKIMYLITTILSIFIIVYLVYFFPLEDLFFYILDS